MYSSKQLSYSGKNLRTLLLAYHQSEAAEAHLSESVSGGTCSLTACCSGQSASAGSSETCEKAIINKMEIFICRDTSWELRVYFYVISAWTFSWKVTTLNYMKLKSADFWCNKHNEMFPQLEHVNMSCLQCVMLPESLFTASLSGWCLFHLSKH